MKKTLLPIIAVLTMAQSFQGKSIVHDGDTINLGKSSFRLRGVDAPELLERGGKEARDELIKIIGLDMVMCSYTGHMSYKRMEAVCSTSTYSDIGAELIRRGFALDCPRYSLGLYTHLEPIDARKRLPSKPYCRR